MHELEEVSSTPAWRLDRNISVIDQLKIRKWVQSYRSSKLTPGPRTGFRSLQTIYKWIDLICGNSEGAFIFCIPMKRTAQNPAVRLVLFFAALAESISSPAALVLICDGSSCNKNSKFHVLGTNRCTFNIEVCSMNIMQLQDAHATQGSLFGLQRQNNCTTEFPCSSSPHVAVTHFLRRGDYPDSQKLQSMG